MKRAIVLLVVLLAGALAFSWRRGMQYRLVVSPREVALPADGAVHRAFEVRLSRGGRIDAGAVTIQGLSARLLGEGEDAVAVEIRSPVNPGDQRLMLAYRGHHTSVGLQFLPDASDRFGDGTPDFLRLHTATDRAAFRAWFTTLADTAAGLSPQRLPQEIGDCAALLRWCYRNALHGHDVAWLAVMPLDTLGEGHIVKQENGPQNLVKNNNENRQ